MEEQAFLLFSVGPVQAFIAAARSLRDLWTGSYMLAWLSRQAMQPVIDRFGPQAIVSPDMTDDPLALPPAAGAGKWRAPGLPNRFVAEVPAAGAPQLAEACKQAFNEAWHKLHSAVRESLEKAIGGHAPCRGDWDDSVRRFWDAQVESFFDVRAVVLPFAECPDAVVAGLLGSEPVTEAGAAGAGRPPADGRLWTRRLQLAWALLAADKNLRKVTRYQPPPDAEGRFAGKCSLLGTYEQLGPAKLEDSARFWQAFAESVRLGGVQVRKGERLCALSLVKRFAWPAFFVKARGEDPRALRFEDTATVAANRWLAEEPAMDAEEVRRRQGFWSGQWLHWVRRDQDPDEACCPSEVWDRIGHKRQKQGPPPAYYAILMLDGDQMGQRLRDQLGPDHFRKVSRTLAQFALEYAERIVEQHSGTLIYCGGDDLLALLPTAEALACAAELNKEFRENWQQGLPQAKPATLSGGLAIVHHKEDLRFALEAARAAEKEAKHSGRDALVLSTCRRSGEHHWALCPWEFLRRVQEWLKAFLPRGGQPGASDRWAYHLYRELPTLKGLPREAMLAEIRRQVDRAEEETRKRLGGGSPRDAGRTIASQFTEYCSGTQPRGLSEGESLQHFITLCQTASFLARGREA